jgi:hypothetical protein
VTPAPRTWALEAHETAAELMGDPEWLARMRDNVRDFPDQAGRYLAFIAAMGELMRSTAGLPHVPDKIRGELLRSADDCAEAAALIRSAAALSAGPPRAARSPATCSPPACRSPRPWPSCTPA